MPKLWSDKILKTLADSINKKIESEETAADCVVDESMERYWNIPSLSCGGVAVPIDIYKPVTKSGMRLPVIMYIHGGALMLGNKRMAAGFCELLASKGYIVCALDYRHVPDVRIYEELADVSAGMDTAAGYIGNLNADCNRIYMVAESAGAFLAVYANAMKQSEGLRQAVGYAPTSVRFRAMALISGMFYTKNGDTVGLLKSTYYGIDERSKLIEPYTDPENPEIIGSLPPCLLITSQADFLRNYSYEYSTALGAKNMEHRLVNMGSDRRLKHAFPAIHPEYPESAAAVDTIAEWFNEH